MKRYTLEKAIELAKKFKALENSIEIVKEIQQQIQQDNAAVPHEDVGHSADVGLFIEYKSIHLELSYVLSAKILEMVLLTLEDNYNNLEIELEELS